MGWWKIKDVETGRIDHGHTKENRAGCSNAVPGDAEDEPYLVNGDEPADLMNAALDTICDCYRRAWHRNPKLDELRAVFNFVTNPSCRRNPDGDYVGAFRHRVAIRPASPSEERGAEIYGKARVEP